MFSTTLSLGVGLDKNRRILYLLLWNVLNFTCDETEPPVSIAYVFFLPLQFQHTSLTLISENLGFIWLQNARY